MTEMTSSALYIIVMINSKRLLRQKLDFRNVTFDLTETLRADCSGITLKTKWYNYYYHIRGSLILNIHIISFK